MCFYAFSEDGEIDLDVSEFVWVHPKYYRKPDGKSTLVIVGQVTAKSNDINSLRIIYPNLLVDVRTLPLPDTKEFAISRTFSENESALEVMRHFSFEVLTLTFESPLKAKDSALVVLQLESPNASRFESDFREFTLDFTISGPDNVKRSFLQGLDGAEKWFNDKVKSSEDAIERQTYEKLLLAKRGITHTIVESLKKNPISISRFRTNLFVDPALRGLSITGSEELEETTHLGIPDVKWPYTNRVYKALFGEKRPLYASFVYNGKGQKEHKYSIKGSAYRNKPTELYVAIIAIMLMLLLALLT